MIDISSLIILGNAVILGIRHGVDWDHIAAIADIVGTASATKVDSNGVATLAQSNAIRLSSCYAIGHATIVLILGIVALSFATILPEWIDPLMERAVGVTLLLLGVWIFYSILQQPADGQFVLPPVPDNRLYSLVISKDGMQQQDYYGADPKSEPIEVRLQ